MLASVRPKAQTFRSCSRCHKPWFVTAGRITDEKPTYQDGTTNAERQLDSFEPLSSNFFRVRGQLACLPKVTEELLHSRSWCKSYQKFSRRFADLCPNMRNFSRHEHGIARLQCQLLVTELDAGFSPIAYSHSSWAGCTWRYAPLFVRLDCSMMKRPPSVSAGEALKAILLKPRVCASPSRSAPAATVFAFGRSCTDCASAIEGNREYTHLHKITSFQGVFLE